MRALTVSSDNTRLVISFPISRQVETVQRVAGSLAVQHGETAGSNWRQMIADMRGRTISTGIPEGAIVELRAFSASVFSESRDQCA